MSEASVPAPHGRSQLLPEWLRPREEEPLEERAEGRPRGRRWLIETTVLLLAALALTIATVNDVVLQTHTNHRLVADLHTWRLYTGHDYRNLSAEQDQRHHTTVDVICGNTSPGPPKERIQLCLQMSGAVRDGRRAARGGWYLPPKAEDLHHYRYGCFGPAKLQEACPR